MERRALLAVAISILILVLYQEVVIKRYSPPPQEMMPAEVVETEPGAEPPVEAAPEGPPVAAPVAPEAAPALESLPPEDFVEEDFHIKRMGETREWHTMTNAEIRLSISRYLALVTYHDACFGKVLDALEEKGMQDNTLVTFSPELVSREKMSKRGTAKRSIIPNIFGKSGRTGFTVFSRDIRISSFSRTGAA